MFFVGGNVKFRQTWKLITNHFVLVGVHTEY